MLSAVLLCWTVLKLHAPGTCYPLQLATSQPDAVQGEPEEQGRAETQSVVYDNFMEESHYGREWKTIHQGSEGKSTGIFTYLKNPPKGCFSILNVKNKKFFCLDSKRRLYTSVDDSNEDCRFHHIRRHKHFDVFRFCRGDVLAIHQQMKATTHTHNPSELSISLQLKQHQKHTKGRKRRSWNIDPSDPLGSEYPDVRAINNQRRVPPYTGNISKETIALVDDPLQVLLSDSPRSPTLEKNRKNKQIRF